MKESFKDLKDLEGSIYEGLRKFFLKDSFF